MLKPTTRRIAAVLVLGVCLFAAACSSSESAGGDAFIDAETGRFSVLAALRQTPRSAAPDRITSSEPADLFFEVSVVDLHSAVEQSGLTRPTDSRDSLQLTEHFAPLMRLLGATEPTLIYVDMPPLLLSEIEDLGAYVDEFGFAPSDVTRFVAVESRSTEFVVLGGVESDVDAPAQRARVVSEGVFRSSTNVPISVAERDGLVGLSNDGESLVEWLEGPMEQTFADDRVLSNIATRLDEARVVSAALWSVPKEFGRAHQGLGFGWALDNDEPRGVVVFAYATPAEAQDQLAIIATRFDEHLAYLESGLPPSGAEAHLLVKVEELEVLGSEVVAHVSFPPGGSPNSIVLMAREGRGPFARQD